MRIDGHRYRRGVRHRLVGFQIADGVGIAGRLRISVGIGDRIRVGIRARARPEGHRGADADRLRIGDRSGDFSSALFRTPAGFARVQGYYQVVPLEQSYLSWYSQPTGESNTHAVIAVLVYTLPEAGLVETAAAQRTRIDYYNRRVKATVDIPLEAVPVAGRPGFRETLDQPGGFHYVTYFAFGARHVVQVSCQSGAAAQESLVRRGCQSVLSSLSVR